jgi:hypothetical protein
MKKITAYMVISLAAVTVLPSFLRGQTNNQMMETAIISENPSSLVSPENNGSFKNVNAKVMRSFIRFFRDTSDAFWTLHKNYYSVQFNTGSRRTIAIFGLKGYLYYTVYYGTEKDLPTIEKNIILDAYPDFKITWVQEVNNRLQTFWLVTIKNCNSIRKVKIAGEEFFEYEKFIISSGN